MDKNQPKDVSTKDRLLIGLLGASPDAISKLTQSDRNMARRLVISLAVPVSMMAVGASYAALTFGATWVGILCTGGVCALIIFIVDTFILASGFRQSEPNKKAAMFVVRLTLSVVLSLVISTPLKMALFGDTLANERRQTKLLEVEKKTKSLNIQNERALQSDPTLKQLTVKYNDAINDKKTIQDKIDHYQALAVKFGDNVRLEIKSGCKAKCEEYKRLRQDALGALNRHMVQLKAVNTTLTTITGDKSSHLNDLKATATHRIKTLQGNQNLEKQDIVTQLRQLQDLSNREPIVRFASIILMLAFILLELTPMLGKSFFRFESLKFLIAQEEQQSIKTIMVSNTTMLAENMKTNANQIENLEYGSSDPVHGEIWRQMKQMVIMKNIDMMYENMNISNDFKSQAKQEIKAVEEELKAKSDEPWMNV